jgi:high-affinity iron transporter
MLQALLVTFREGIESFLIVGVIVGYLRKTGRARLVRGVQVGLAIAALASLGGAWLWLQVPNQPLYEGIAALSAAVLVGLLLAQMLRMGRHVKGQIEARVAKVAGDAAGASSLRALTGVALVTALLVTRELLEAVFYVGVQAMALRASSQPAQGALVLVGAGLGLVVAGAVAWYWTRFSHRLQLHIVLKVTALFLGLFLLQLLIYGVHELAESGVIQGSQAFHDATELFGPDGRVGHLISYSLLAAPLLYLIWSRRARRPATPQPKTAT